MNRFMSSCIISFLAAAPILAQMNSPEKFVALQSHYNDKEQVDPGVILIWVGVGIVILVITLIQRQIHMHHLKKQHEEMMKHQKEMASHQKEILNHIRSKR